MKSLLLLLLSLHLPFAAEVDTKLFEGEQRDAYYQKVQTEIDASLKSGRYDKKIIHEERALLAKLREESLHRVSINVYDDTQMSKQKSISRQSFQEAIQALASLRLQMFKEQKSLEWLQSKIAFSKQKIENIITEEKEYLLSYQLQFALYKLQQKNYETKTVRLKEENEKITQTLKASISLVECKDKEQDRRLEIYTERLEKLSKKRIAMEVQREKELIDDPRKLELFKGRWAKINTDYEIAVANKIALQINQALCLIKEDRDEAFFKGLAEITAHIQELSPQQILYHEAQKEILIEIAKASFGTTQLFLGATKHQLLEILSQIKGFTTSALFVFNEQPISLLSLLKMLLLIILSFLVGNFYKKRIIRLSRNWSHLSQMSIRLIANLGYYLIVFTGIILALSSIGVDMSSISLIAGALSIGIGFGLQTVVSNFIAGLILMFERTIRVGDTIEISNELKGKVTDMRIRSTTIQTFDNLDIVIPNASFIQNNVINWTLEDKTRRIHIPFSVAYGTQVEDVKKAIFEELSLSGLIYINDNPAKAPEIWMVAMSSSSVDYELLVWIEWISKLRPNALHSDFLILIYNTLRKRKIEIPFPQLDLHIKESVVEAGTQKSEDDSRS